MSTPLVKTIDFLKLICNPSFFCYMTANSSGLFNERFSHPVRIVCFAPIHCDFHTLLCNDRATSSIRIMTYLESELSSRVSFSRFSYKSSIVKCSQNLGKRKQHRHMKGSKRRSSILNMIRNAVIHINGIEVPLFTCNWKFQPFQPSPAHDVSDEPHGHVSPR